MKCYITIFAILFFGNYLVALDYISNIYLQKQDSDIVVKYELAPLSSEKYYVVFVKFIPPILGKLGNLTIFQY
jgi:hypothetical protein